MNYSSLMNELWLNNVLPYGLTVIIWIWHFIDSHYRNIEIKENEKILEGMKATLSRLREEK